MNTTAIRRFDNSHAPIISPTWILDGLRDVRDLLQAEGRDDLAEALSQCVGGFLRRSAAAEPAGRRLDDGGPDYEDAADPRDWPAWTDRSAWTTTEPTPLDVLAAFGLPPVAGGAPDREPFEPSAADWDDYFAHRDDGPLTEDDVIRATGCC